MNNYPDNTYAGDPSAPWNAIETTVVCPECAHESTDAQEGEICEDCDDALYIAQGFDPEWLDGPDDI